MTSSMQQPGAPDAHGPAGSRAERPGEASNTEAFAQVTGDSHAWVDQDYFPLQGKPLHPNAGSLVTALDARYLIDLGERDGAVLRGIAGRRFLRTDQIRRVFFADLGTPGSQARSTTRVLRRLAKHKLVDALPQRIGGAKRGSAAIVWHATKRTTNQLRQLGDPVSRAHVFGQPEFLAHTLDVAEAHVQLVELARAGEIEVAKVQIEPESWRDMPVPGGRGRVRPDLFAVTARGEYETHRFVEIDRGTESLPRITAKCERYQAYYQSGVEQAEHGVFPSVLWVAPGEARADGIRRAIASMHGIEAGLFSVITADQFARTMAQE